MEIYVRIPVPNALNHAGDALAWTGKDHVLRVARMGDGADLLSPLIVDSDLRPHVALGIKLQDLNRLCAVPATGDEIIERDEPFI